MIEGILETLAYIADFVGSIAAVVWPEPEREKKPDDDGDGSTADTDPK